MKKNVFYLKAYLAMLMVGLLIFTSCNNEEDPEPTPDFSYSIDDKTVSFTNASTDASSYSWDFGDDSGTSTEENPVYTYSAYGDYDVRLTATGPGGEAIQKTTISVSKEWPTITIDGDFSDWDDIDALYSYDGTESGSLLEAKVTSDEAYSALYIYIKGDLDTSNVLQIVVNADGDVTTGWQEERYTSNGLEYIFEYYIHDLWAGTYGWSEDSDQSWPWGIDLTNDATNGDITESSGVIDDAEMEFVIQTSLMQDPAVADSIGICFWAQNTAWSQIGQLPPINASLDVSFFVYQ